MLSGGGGLWDHLCSLMDFLPENCPKKITTKIVDQPNLKKCSRKTLTAFYVNA